MDRYPNKRDVSLDGESLTLASVLAVSRRDAGKGPKVKISAKAKARVVKAHKYVSKIAKGNVAVYGINTGFGLLSDVRIDANKLEELQINLLRSHATGVGTPLPEDVVRAALLLRANTLAKGHSGCSVELIQAIIDLLNNGISPWIPRKGSVGACGDLAPLAHMSLVLIGEGKAYYKGKLISGARALKLAGLKPYQLQAKEGLSLINGTQIMTAIAALTLHDALELVKIADIAGAMSLEAFQGTSKAFDPNVHRLRPHKGQLAVAKNLNRLAKGSKIAESHIDCDRVQDPYSFRCMPQVHGVSRDYVRQALECLETEFNSSTDNPLVFLPEDLKGEGAHVDGGEIVSGGNFHGQYPAMTMDVVAIALSELANISDQRIQKLINPSMSKLPAFLTKDPGLNSGMMIVQVAAAALVSENKVLCHPASVDSIPTSADKEDHVSMGVTAARKAAEVLDNVRHVLAMELLCASQGLEFHKPLKAGKALNVAYELIREKVKPIGRDRAFHKDIEAITDLLRKGTLLRAVEQSIGELN